MHLKKEGNKIRKKKKYNTIQLRNGVSLVVLVVGVAIVE